MAVLVLRRPRLYRCRIDAQQRRAEEFLHRREKARHTPAVEHVFQPRLGAVGAVALGDEHAQHSFGNARCVLRPHDDIGGMGEVAMAGDAAETQAIVNAGRNTEPVRHLHRAEGDVVGVLQHRDASAAVEGDVELARQAVELAVVQDEVMQRSCVRPRVDQLLRIDPRGRAAGDVADVVRAGTARGQADLREAHQHLGRLVRPDLADLQVGARGDVGIAAAQVLGDRRHAAELVRVQDAARDAQPAHVGVLCRCHVEQAEELAEEDVRSLGKARLGSHRADLVEPIERMLLPLCFLLCGELAAGSDGAVLCGAMRVGRRRFDRCQRLAGDGTACLHASHEALQVLLLIRRECGVVAHGASSAPLQSPSATAAAGTGRAAVSRP